MLLTINNLDFVNEKRLYVRKSQIDATVNQIVLKTSTWGFSAEGVANELKGFCFKPL